MKTKKLVASMLLITCLLITGIVYGEDPVKGAGNDSTTSGTGMGWQEHTGRQWVIINDGLRFSTGVGVGMTGVNWSVNISSNVNTIECCQWTTLKQSWCNYNADDPRCLD
jgi:hypothetical protein